MPESALQIKEGLSQIEGEIRRLPSASLDQVSSEATGSRNEVSGSFIYYFSPYKNLKGAYQSLPVLYERVCYTKEKEKIP